MSAAAACGLPVPTAASSIDATGCSNAQAKRWTITSKDEILMIAAPKGFPHLFPLNPKHVWPISAERLRTIEKEARDKILSALCLLGHAFLDHTFTLSGASLLLFDIRYLAARGWV